MYAVVEAYLLSLGGEYAFVTLAVHVLAVALVALELHNDLVVPTASAVGRCTRVLSTGVTVPVRREVQFRVVVVASHRLALAQHADN